ncbi:hypothetical protein [Brachybacterium hainanense]|uniref:Uncharacterized protein n=1 Tax=Brachybacterium hainanense TaxID=1541174 RepID=A0ABV6RF71_9MICO
MKRGKIRLEWDYVLIFEWSEDTIDPYPNNVTQVLPLGLVERIKRWGKQMDSVFGNLYLSTAPAVNQSVRDSLESDFLAICAEIEDLGFIVEPKGRWPFDVP